LGLFLDLPARPISSLLLSLLYYQIYSVIIRVNVYTLTSSDACTQLSSPRRKSFSFIRRRVCVCVCVWISPNSFFQEFLQKTLQKTGE
jgi:hypothetical protein